MDRLNEEATRLEFGVHQHFKGYELKLMQHKMEFSEEMLVLLKHSKEDNMRAFRKEYMAKRAIKGT